MKGLMPYFENGDHRIAHSSLISISNIEIMILACTDFKYVLHFDIAMSLHILWLPYRHRLFSAFV